MAEKHLDHPGEWRCLGRHRPAAPLGPCPHDCDHSEQWVIAWGPTHSRYELVACVGGCDSTCRAWTDGTARATSPWLHVAVDEAQRIPQPG